MTNFINNRHPQRTMRYVFFISLILWIVTSIFIVYTYIWSSSEKVSSKGGTFVEGIFNSTSYLPYLRTDEQSLFYQGLLFNSCLSHTIQGQTDVYAPDMCDVQTSDNQTYLISLSGTSIRSDGTPMSVDDIEFTYDEIVTKNKWGLKWLNMYKDIKVSRENPKQIKVIFPSASLDNKLFFTNYILPQHILQEFDLQNYKEVFSLQPTYTNCANIVPQTTDQYSLIFNLFNCNDTHLNFYQIKNLITFENFSDGKNAKNSIVDIYLGESPLSGYFMHKLMTNKIVTVFFNTNSDKLRVRTRRALGGLIKRNFYTTGYDNYVIKNTDGLFDVFLSTGVNIAEYLMSTEANGINKKDLIDSKVQAIPSTIEIKGTNQKAVYFVEDPKSAKSITTSFSENFDSVALEHKGKTAYDKYYSSKNRKATFTLSQAGTFEPGINKYTLRGRQKGKKVTIATIDIYNIVPENTGTGTTIDPMTVLYFNNEIYIPIVENLKGIFERAGISEYFIFKAIDDPEEFQSTLLLGDYDITLNTIDMGQKRDITKLFATDSAKTNPSQYQNQNLISLLQQYGSNQQLRILNEINDIYAKDMPFVILGKAFVPMYIKDDLVKKILPTPDTQLYDYNWRTSVYKNLELVNNIHVDGKRVWNTENFMSFIKKSLGIESGNPTTNTGSAITPNL